ncbi:MAG: prepilin-type N-terminal cleavage/methylation domain-containing protein [Deltaproteobacteria bacterium]|nr:prepilin-type N-terminal cleavage/methylation domain-containing protein [Deltaproteobacteria bacterium]
MVLIRDKDTASVNTAAFEQAVQDDRGFTLIELLMVFIVLGILAQMTTLVVLDMKSRSHDLMALSDGRNLVTVIRDNFVDLVDVDYTHNPGDGPNIGTVDTGGAPRTEPVFRLSPGVDVTLTGKSDPTAPGTGFVQGTFYHTDGTDDPITPSGKREFYFVVDELGTDVLATF